MSTVDKKTRQSDFLVRTTLKANWAFSLLSGLILILFEESFRRIFELSYPFSITGVQLILFSAMVAFAAFYPTVLKKYIYFIIIMDMLWVAYCISILFTSTAISNVGNGLILFSGVVVAVFAIYQYKGLQKVNQAES